MATDIFISYRRQDAAAFAARLRDRLELSFPGQVFLDVSVIRGGTDFPAHLDQSVRAARVLIAVISPGWQTNRDGSTCLGDAGDFVTREIVAAFAAGITVIPVLMDGCAMPGATSLPESLRALAQRSALTITHERFDSDTTHLVDALYGPLGVAPPGRIERILEVAGGGTRIHPRARDTFAFTGAAVAGLSLLLTVLWLLDHRADPLEGTHVLMFSALGIVLGLVGRRASKWRKLALTALALSGVALLTYVGAGTWRALSMPMEPWMQSNQDAALHSHLPVLPEERVAWHTRPPFTTPPPSVTCECLTRTAHPRQQRPYDNNAKFGFHNACEGPVAFVLARVKDAGSATFYPWFSGRGREFAVVTLSPSQSVSVSVAGAWNFAVQPWVCQRTRSMPPATPMD